MVPASLVFKFCLREELSKSRVTKKKLGKMAREEAACSVINALSTLGAWSTSNAADGEAGGEGAQETGRRVPFQVDRMLTLLGLGWQRGHSSQRSNIC